MSIYFNQTEYPNLDLAIIGTLKNKAYGVLKAIPAAGIVTGATSLLASAITSTATSLTVVDASRFPATPFIIQINAERMNVTSKAGAVFDITRGYDSTEAVAHSAEQTVFEVLTEYIYLLNDGPVDEITAVYIDGIKQPPANYTAYTGQTGDSHPDWPGVAVISFSANAYISKQYNLTAADINLISNTKPGIVEYASHHELLTVENDALLEDISGGLWSSQIGLTGAKTTSMAFVKFATDFGTINTQTYYVDVENASADLETINGDIMVTEGDDVKLSQPFSIPKNQKITLEISRAGGIFDDVLRIYSAASDLIVTDMRKSVLLAAEAQAATDNTLTQEVAVLNQLLITSPVRFATYPATALGTGIVKQTHVVELVDASGDDEFIHLTIMAVEKNGTLLAERHFTLTGSANFYGSLTHDGGSYDTATIVLVNNLPPNVIQNVKIKKLIKYTITAAAAGQENLVATSSGKIVVGNVISADGNFAVDTTGDYGGVGNLIQRPDWVIKHYLVTEKGAALADIDTASFAAAGTFYNTASYNLNFLRSLSVNEDQMAEECRSVVYMTQGKYYLDIVPDTAPAATVTISESEVIDAPGFKYDHGKFEDLHTDYTARYGLNADGTWAGIVTAVDAGNKYGTRKQSVDLPLVATSTMAQSVLNHILLQHEELYSDIKFKAPWKYESLQIGDTFQVECSLYNNAKFFVEKKEVLDDNIIYIEGKQWW